MTIKESEIGEKRECIDCNGILVLTKDGVWVHEYNIKNTIQRS